jgi:hypothetical protein
MQESIKNQKENESVPAQIQFRTRNASHTLPKLALPQLLVLEIAKQYPGEHDTNTLPSSLPNKQGCIR